MYFHHHPEMVLGRWSRDDRLYADGYSVKSNGDLSEQLRQAVARLPSFAPIEASAAPEPGRQFTPPPTLPHITEGSFFISEDGAIRQVVDGQAEQVVYGGIKMSSFGRTMTEKRFTALIRMKEQDRRVLQSQNEGWPEAEREEERRRLRGQYDRFVSLYGPINKTTFSETADGTVIRRMPNLVKFREDPDAMLVMALEEYDEVTGTAKKAAIMEKDVVGQKPPVTKVGSAEDGLLVSLDRRGAVDLPFMAQLYGKPEESIIAELGDLIFKNPDTRLFETADEYLSGNVRAKLARAESAGPEYARNADALRKVQPEDLLPSEIDANLGSPWIPARDIQAFAAELFNVPLDSVEIAHSPKDAVWSVEGDFQARQSVAAMSDYGTPRANGTWLLEQALNMKLATVYDPDPDDPKKRVVNQEDTLAAREKQRQIKEKFRAWIFTDPDRTERLIRVYNDLYNNLRPRRFDGSHLEFPGMSTAIQLRQHQKDAVWRMMSSGNTLLAHCVGAGKTGCMAAAAMKMKQAGLLRKPLMCVPNHLLEQFAREFQQWYPNAKLLVASKEDFTREKRKHLTAKIATGDWDAIIVTHSSFERIGMSRPYQEEFLREQIAEYEQLLIEHAASKGGNRNIIKALEKQKAAREKRLKDLLAEDKKDDGLVFEELGVDHLFIDEFQEFKNLETPTKMDRVAGVQRGGSERAFDLYMKSRYLHQRHPGHGLTGATGTPVSNSLVELYTLQRYFDPEGLKARGIDHFDAWAGNFGEIVEAMEISPDGKTLKPRSRFAGLVNWQDLYQMYRAFADVQTAEMLKLPRPRLEGGKPQVIACPMSEEQEAIQQELVERYDKIRSTRVDPRIDNALKITTDGRKLSLSARLLSSTSLTPVRSKIDLMIDMIADTWRDTQGTKSTQMIFCDLGVHPTSWGYSVYDEIVEKLVKTGIPRAEIAVIGDADSDAKKRALFDKVRAGQVRILIGSTQKMGTGTNVQKRLRVLHELDAPWRPCDVEQREGRILRQGNENDEVTINRYVTEGSFDAYLWQTLETKARAFSRMMAGDCTERRVDDIGAQELSYAEVKAIASGNPAVLTLAQADAEIQRLTILKKNHADELYLAWRKQKELPGAIDRLSQRLAALTADSKTASAHAGDRIIIGQHRVSAEDTVAVLGDRLDALPVGVQETRDFPLGVYQGLRFGVLLHPQFAPEIYLEGAITRTAVLSREHRGPRAVLNALARLVESYGPEGDRVRQDLGIAQAQLRDFQARLGQPFAHEDYLARLTTLRDQLRAGLSGSAPDADREGQPSVAELAEEIKALRAANTVEAAPERTGKRQLSAEEPVTTRIRRRAEELAVTEGEGGQAPQEENRWRRAVATIQANTQRIREVL
jgi:N12 class adenine-specific DNA methylase